MIYGVGVGIGVWVTGKLPIAGVVQTLRRIDHKMSGKNFGKILENTGAGCVCRSDRKKFLHALTVDCRGDGRMTKERFWLRTKDQRAFHLRIEERFDTCAVTVEQKLLLLFIIDGKSEDSIQFLDKRRSEVHITVKDDFGIRGCFKMKFSGRKFCFQFFGVVNFPVVYNGAGMIVDGAGHRLRSTLNAGDTFTLTARDITGNEKEASITYKNLVKDVQPGMRILIDDGLIEMRVKELTDTDIVCEVENGGVVSNHKGINVPDAELTMPYISEKDRNDLIFGVEQGFDFVAASFVRCADDIVQLRNLLSEHGDMT